MYITERKKSSSLSINDIEEKAKLPTNDVVFHSLFGTKGNEKITKDFIETVLNRPVTDIELDLNLNLIREHYDDKLGILDVRAKSEDGINYNIEMQNITSETLPERILSYWSRLYNGDLRIGHNYDTLNKTIAILILNDDMKRLEIIDKFHTKWNLREENYTNVILTDYLEIHILELKKYTKMKTKDNNNIWLDFILEPEGREVLQAMKENEQLKEANKKWRKITEDDILRDRALRLEIAQLDYNTGMKHAKESGLKERNGNWRKQTVWRLEKANGLKERHEDWRKQTD